MKLSDSDAAFIYKQMKEGVPMTVIAGTVYGTTQKVVFKALGEYEDSHGIYSVPKGWLPKRQHTPALTDRDVKMVEHLREEGYRLSFISQIVYGVDGDTLSQWLYTKRKLSK